MSYITSYSTNSMMFRNYYLTVNVNVPKYNYDEAFIENLNEILASYQYEFDTPEVIEEINEKISKIARDYIQNERDKKIDQIIDDTGKI